MLQTVCPLTCVYELRRVIAPRETKHQVDCNTIFRGRVSKSSSKCFHQNSVPDTCFDDEMPPSHIRPAMDIHVLWWTPRTGTQCIISSAASLSCLQILKSNRRETVSVAAKNVNTSQSDSPVEVMPQSCQF